MPDPTADHEPELLTITEAADLLRAPVATLRYWRHRNIGPHSFRLGRRVLYRRDDLRTWIDEKAGRLSGTEELPPRGRRGGHTGDPGTGAAGWGERAARATSSPARRALRARMAAHHLHAGIPDAAAHTAPARAAFLGRFEREVDPDGVLDPRERARRAQHARKAYFLRLALASAHAREARRGGGPRPAAGR
jgi:Helix-turn-helix domain